MQTFPKNISQNFAYILDPNTFPGKANPFSQFILVFGDVAKLQHLQMPNMRNEKCFLEIFK